jgi:hypothetical protein
MRRFSPSPAGAAGEKKLACVVVMRQSCEWRLVMISGALVPERWPEFSATLSGTWEGDTGCPRRHGAPILK